MNIPKKCPSCDGVLKVAELCCDDCKTSIQGRFDLPMFACLSDEEDRLLKIFLSARGSIKEVERSLGISYPTVKARLEQLLAKLGLGQSQDGVRLRRLEVVEKLERGEINAAEAIKCLREL
jgi:hypothetical protein